MRLDASWTGDPSTARQKSKFKIPQPIQCPTCNLTPFPHLLFKMEWDTVYGNKHARPVLRCSIPAMQHAQSHASNRMRKWRLSMRTREPECAHLQTYTCALTHALHNASHACRSYGHKRAASWAVSMAANCS